MPPLRGRVPSCRAPPCAAVHLRRLDMLGRGASNKRRCPALPAVGHGRCSRPRRRGQPPAPVGPARAAGHLGAPSCRTPPARWARLAAARAHETGRPRLGAQRAAPEGERGCGPPRPCCWAPSSAAAAEARRESLAGRAAREPRGRGRGRGSASPRTRRDSGAGAEPGARSPARAPRRAAPRGGKEPWHGRGVFCAQSGLGIS